MKERPSEQLTDAIADLLMSSPKVAVQENISRAIYSMFSPGRNLGSSSQKLSEAICQIPSPEDGARRTDLSQSPTSSTPDIGTLAEMPVDDTLPPIAVGVQTPHAAVMDLLFWRSMYLSILVLLVATATWVTLQLYQYHVVEVVSRVAMLLVTLIFVWGNIHRLLKNEDPDLSGIEISESRAEGMARGIREWIDEGIRWLFRVGVEREWSVFGATVGALGLLSWIATHFDLLTIVYMGVVLGMTVPAIYVNHKETIIELWNAIYLQGLSACPCI
ncbi:reticulon-like protein B13 isoform X2 [Coffea eugenioides]|uniref:reticulon-like protein B13 isoform X2 n=1 Tax=Coffea eugenioides TaxID=49369 RepID=UPI000F604582|nr:reticulon-like protein B13 isoform X2 [Coffea eugenioides]